MIVQFEYYKFAFACKMSAEPRRRKPYGNDLRWRIVYQRIALTFTFEKIARNLNIGVSTAFRIYSRFERTGDIEPTIRKTRRELRKLDEQSELYVIGVVIANPSLYLGELCKEVEEHTGILVAPPTICRLLRSYGITRKKIQQRALQRLYDLRGAFMAHCFMFKAEMFVWVDESGCNAKDHIRKYGYSLRGSTPVCHRILSRGQRVNVIVAMSTDGVIAMEHTTSTVNGEVFYDYARGSLIPSLLPFNGTKPRSIVILDNCSVHHVQEVIDLFAQSGVLLLFLPPYSPDLNPIEELFSYFKNYLRKHDDVLQSVRDPTDIIRSAFESITSQHCLSWISHAGYNL